MAIWYIYWIYLMLGISAIAIIGGVIELFRSDTI
jgi:hypothetical protein